MSQKLTIVLLVVVAVVFVIAIVVGASQKGSVSVKHPGAAGALKGLQGNRFLTIGNKASTNCQALNNPPTVLRVPGSCVIAVDKRSIFSSSTRVAFTTDGPLSVRTETKSIPEDHQTSTVAGGKCYGSAVDHSGGTITLSASPSATIFLQTTACPDDAGS